MKPSSQILSLKRDVSVHIIGVEKKKKNPSKNFLAVILIENFYAVEFDIRY